MEARAVKFADLQTSLFVPGKNGKGVNLKEKITEISGGPASSSIQELSMSYDGLTLFVNVNGVQAATSASNVKCVVFKEEAKKTK